MRRRAQGRVWQALVWLTIIAAPAAGQGSATPDAKPYEAISLSGAVLTSVPAPAAAVAAYEQARREFEAGPTEDRYIWLGRRTAYLGRYRDAITIYSEGLSKYPESYRLYRHRGHRFISIRQFGRAIADFEKAAALAQGKPLEVEPDGAPNAAGVPVSNTHFNIYYHLGLAYYLTRDFAKAEAAYRNCLAWSKNDDSVVAVSDWLYMTLRRTGRAADAAAVLAPIRRDMRLIENGAYLDRLLLFKGEIAAETFAKSKAGESASEQAIRAYGMGLVRLWAGDPAGARDWFTQLLRAGSWASFATIAAERELADLDSAAPDRRTVASVLAAWTTAWNLYDLDAAMGLFASQPAPTYFSSEKPGRIEGRDALAAHHRGFGFVPGGKPSDSRLWIEAITVEARGDTAWATATWYFDRDVAGPVAPQRGPVTFVLVRGGDGWRVVHAHFANDPPAAGR
jgi:tetratricopeptide (TPR) repeat protein